MAQVIARRGGYYSDFRAGGKRIQRFLSKDKREAQIALGHMLEEVRGGSSGRPSRNISWSGFKERYLEYSRGNKKPQTVDRDISAISALDRTFPIKRLNQITPELLESWKARRLAANKGRPTISRDVKALKALLHKAEAWGYLEKRDWTSVKDLKATRKKLYFHTPAELGRLLSYCNGIWRTICLLGSRAGLRREEIYMLTWEDVDFVRGRLHVTSKDGWQPKDYEQRFVGMAVDLRAHLHGLKKGSRWVIALPDGTRPRIAIMSAYFQKLSRKAGLRGSIHILRHTYASHLVQAGVPLKTVKDLLGHSSMATTEIYAELAPENIDRAALMLPKIPSSVASGAASGRSPHEVGSGRVKSGSFSSRKAK